jgi:hypothetical protein
VDRSLGRPWCRSSAQSITVVVAIGLLACKWVPHQSDAAEQPSSTASTQPEQKSGPENHNDTNVPKEGYVEVTVGGVTMSDDTNVVFLLDPARENAVPIFIGTAEAFSIQLRLDERRFRRPLTHDLFDSAVSRLGGKVENVRIDQIKQHTFHATLVVTRGKERHELDARSSDAIAIALGNGAPIHMAQTVIRQSGVDVSRLEGLAKSKDPPRAPPPPKEAPIKL